MHTIDVLVENERRRVFWQQIALADPVEAVVARVDAVWIRSPAPYAWQLDHRDRSSVSFFFGQAVPQQRPVPLPFPPDVQIEGDPCFRLPRGDFVVHAPSRYRASR